MASVKGYLAIVSALVLCPCHLPILAVVLAGTALGSVITEHFALLFPITAIYFIGALFLGLRWMTRNEAPACGPCEAPAPDAEQPGAAETSVPPALESEPERVGEREPVGGVAWK